MVDEKDIGKVGDSQKFDRSETAQSTAEDAVIAGGQKHEHQMRHKEMESSGLNFEGMSKLQNRNGLNVGDRVDDGSGQDNDESITIVSVNPETNEEIKASGNTGLTENDLEQAVHQKTALSSSHGIAVNPEKTAKEILTQNPPTGIGDPHELLTSNNTPNIPNLGNMRQFDDIQSDAGSYKVLDPEIVEISQNISSKSIEPQQGKSDSQKLLDDTTERLKNSLTDGHLSTDESMDLMRRMNQKMEKMSQEDRIEFIDGFEEFLVGWGKEHNLKTGLMRDSKDPGSIYAIGWGERTFLNLEAMSGDGKQYPAELVYKSKNPHETKILNDKDGYNCHRTTFELMDHGEEWFRDIWRGATMMSGDDLTGLGYHKTVINSPEELKPGDVLAVPPMSQLPDGSFANVDGPFKHSGTVTRGEGGSLVVTQKIGAGKKYDLIRQSPSDFAGFWTRNSKFQSNPHIYIYRK